MNKEETLDRFSETEYTSVFSKSWWMNAVCGEENWDVWAYEKGGRPLAVLPYYKEKRGEYSYITKALLTQNNGLIISYPADQKISRRQEFEEEIIEAATDYIASLKVDVFEQQFHHSFQNFVPFAWKGYKIIPRVTYVTEDTSNMQRVEDGFSSNYKNTVRKGMRSIAGFDKADPEVFYHEHEKIFLRQNLPCPFSYELWMRLYSACREHDSGEILTARAEDGSILSMSFLVWDEKALYLLMGGAAPEHSSLQTYTALVREAIAMASAKGLQFDFEGSMIRRINHSFREYGGTPKTYYRIRKVFNPDIIRSEAEAEIKGLF